ncbi:ABC transporter substrate-binding protein [Clostridium sp.]|jgi:ABC-type glycerol-3-phosphate transport system substrate-binding protein|uniref:ABC transporter substrate-binding protein n=1 Tax=Clostridium sp. TaxID=1506 RepID=UPI00284CE58E|nr:ABC transporter substrate-binding protein [Clostridium sp.]MDR3598398.1 ABC transporter substrate-binding protein [Clostridium sp.]
MSKIGRMILTTLLAGAMTFSLVGCGGSASKQTSGKAATTVKSDGTIDTSEHVKVKFVVLGNKPTNGRMEEALKQVNEKLNKKINAELELQYVEWADWQTQYNLLLASGDSSIDLITTATDWLDAWPNIKKGSFLPLTEDMLKTYAPETWKSVPAGHWDQCKYNNQIYLIPEDNYTQYTNHGMFYRGDWAKEAGLGQINNFQDLGKYFQYVKDHKNGVIPWDVSGTAANANQFAGGYMESNTPNIEIDGIPVGLSSIFYGKSKDDPYTLTSPYMEGNTLEDFATLMKSWADAKYWREDVLNYDGTTRDLMYAGQSGADQHHSQTYYSEARPTMDIKQPGSDLQMFPFSEPSKNLTKMLITHGALAIGANSKNPERALMVYDLLRNDKEIYALYNYGIEGKDYVITKDNKLGRPDGWDKTKDSLDINFWCGRNDKLEIPDSTLYAGTADMIKNYNSYAIEYPYGKFIFDNSKSSTKIAAMADVCAKYIPKIAFGKVSDPKAEVAAFKQEMMAAGYQDVFNDVQEQLKALKK